MYSSSSVPNVVGIFIDYLAKLLGNLEISQGCKHSVLLAQHYIPVIGWLINIPFNPLFSVTFIGINLR